MKIMLNHAKHGQVIHDVIREHPVFSIIVPVLLGKALQGQGELRDFAGHQVPPEFIAEGAELHVHIRMIRFISDQPPVVMLV